MSGGYWKCQGCGDRFDWDVPHSKGQGLHDFMCQYCLHKDKIVVKEVSHRLLESVFDGIEI